MSLKSGEYTYKFDYLMHGWMFRTLQASFQDGRTLEVGCFEGVMSEKLFEIFGCLDVVEPEASNILKTEKRVPDAQFYNCKLEDFRTDKRYENIFLIHTLEHLEDDVACLEHLSSLLTTTGRLFVVVPNADAGSRRIAEAGKIIPPRKSVLESERLHGHFRTYDQRSLRETIIEASLSIVRDGGIFFKPLANFQFDAALEHGILSKDYLEGCFELGKQFPEFCSSIYAVCERDNEVADDVGNA